MATMNALGWTIPPEDPFMVWTGWKNGSLHHKPFSGYGLRISAEDRDLYFNPRWSSVYVVLSGPKNFALVEIDVEKASFWKGCSELICSEISVWMRLNGLAPWRPGFPPKFKAVNTSERKFIVEPLVDRVN